MFVSVFDLFKIGLGPSSSHTMGPMKAAALFLDVLRGLRGRDGEPGRLRCRLHGSLAWTGRGHGTDRAVILGLAGQHPDTIDVEAADRIEAEVRARGAVSPAGLPSLAFDPETDIVFDFGAPLAAHPNGLVFEALTVDCHLLLRETYFSIGGGFVASEAELTAGLSKAESGRARELFPFPFATATEMLRMGEAAGLSVAAMKRANERGRMSDADLDNGLDVIWAAMRDCVDRGLGKEGTLPGFGLRRRAAAIHAQLASGRDVAWTELAATEWLLVYAMAVNEENAAGARIVTAPTNGAAGVVPSVLLYWRRHCRDACDAGVRTFLLTAAAIGGLVKHNASISGAEVGCQGEVGTAAAMAAAGLCAVLGGTNRQIENAAEIALEHHLGLTCDPARGLVQVPCIERNGLGAVKAVAAASLALRGNGSHFMPLDNCIEAMRQTGAEMSSKYKETALGGLAVNLPQC